MGSGWEIKGRASAADVKIIIRELANEIETAALAGVKKHPLPVINMARLLNAADAAASFVIPIVKLRQPKLK